MRPETGWICVLPAPRHPIETRKERLLPKRNPRLVRARRARALQHPGRAAVASESGAAAARAAAPPSKGLRRARAGATGGLRPWPGCRHLSFLRSAFSGRAWGLPRGQIRPEVPGPGGRTAGEVDVLPAPGGPRCRGAAPDGALSPAPRDPPVMPAAAPR